ncbi:hypothetical protein [Rhizobium sp. MHM7A]|uniref:hypothetical protein n=1 Tax=Rhizobium sp. MHM7A TaxID=2583233 RepID=UPI00110647D3|nr:hypothetical protein [Rhizobium sp. MHM7A]TLX16676.1 hypothetical protein FFR93_04860 [Rhizobium sp. MHM7A]
MHQESDYIVSNDKTKGLRRILGTVIRNMPFTHLIERLPVSEPLMEIASGRNKAYLPLSMVKRLVESAPSKAFAPSAGSVRMNGGDLINLLEVIECEPMPLRTRYAVIDALCVGWAAQVFTMLGDVTLEADQETLALANERGREDGFRFAKARLETAELAVSLTGRPLSRAA